MDNPRTYGSPPFSTALLHGGPGAPGEMAPVAEVLSSRMGVLEPLQTADTIDGQLQELYAGLDSLADPPIRLVGWSWGAWLAFMFSAEHPEMVEKLILVGSGPFEDRYAKKIMSERTDRLDEDECNELVDIILTLNDPEGGDKPDLMSRMIALISKADTYDPLPHGEDVIEFQYDINQKVWGQASRLRISGKLLEMGTRIRCPVVAIHGDCDPHPHKGVEEPLAGMLKDFKFIILEKCGHKPWIERYAKDRFYEILVDELG